MSLQRCRPAIGGGGTAEADRRSHRQQGGGSRGQRIQRETTSVAKSVMARLPAPRTCGRGCLCPPSKQHTRLSPAVQLVVVRPAHPAIVRPRPVVGPKQAPLSRVSSSWCQNVLGRTMSVAFANATGERGVVKVRHAGRCGQACSPSGCRTGSGHRPTCRGGCRTAPASDAAVAADAFGKHCRRVGLVGPVWSRGAIAWQVPIVLFAACEGTGTRRWSPRRAPRRRLARMLSWRLWLTWYSLRAQPTPALAVEHCQAALLVADCSAQFSRWRLLHPGGRLLVYCVTGPPAKPAQRRWCRLVGPPFQQAGRGGS